LLTSPLSLAAQHKHKKGTAPHSHRTGKETHGHRSRYGGLVRTTGPYHIEMVQQELLVYLLDPQGAPIMNERTNGYAMLQTADGKTSQVPLAPVEDHFLVAVPAGSTLRTAVVHMKASGRTLSARYEKLDAVKPSTNRRQPGLQASQLQQTGKNISY
jgi:hypothetical protein